MKRLNGLEEECPLIGDVRGIKIFEEGIKGIQHLV